MSQTFLILAQAPGGGNAFMNVLFIAALFAIMYFVMIRPQQKQMREQRNMLAALKKGDDVITQGGLLGKIYLVTDKFVTLEIANNVRVKILKTSIQGKVSVTEPEVMVKAEEKREEK